ncbi:MAG: RDD family protein [Roseiarcus sp.]|jgi:uncharacterized RDD family membrane protein YckC
MTASTDRVDQLLGGAVRSRREIVTPEGVALHVELAEHGERAAAFLIDMTIWLGVAIFSYLVVVAVLVQTHAIGVAVTIVLFIGFFVRNLYFIYFELAWQGATPGKRINRLRVIDRAGGPLTAGAVIARNLTREVEVFLPLGVILAGAAGGAANVVLGVWLLLLTAMPLFNRDRMRGGDLIAGTIVIALPKRLLLADLAEARAAYAFTSAQLAAYGAFELQVLEELLRKPRTHESVQALEDVSARIRRRIGWSGPPPQRTVEFLTEFYAAERAYLEREQLYGRARADKNAPAG